MAWTSADFRGPQCRSATITVMATRRTSFGKDSGLQARMLLTMFLLGLVYVVFIGVLFAVGAGAGLIVEIGRASCRERV